MKKVFRYVAILLITLMFVPMFNVSKAEAANSYEDPVSYYYSVTDRVNLTEVYGGEML